MLLILVIEEKAFTGEPGSAQPVVVASLQRRDKQTLSLPPTPPQPPGGTSADTALISTRVFYERMSYTLHYPDVEQFWPKVPFIEAPGFALPELLPKCFQKLACYRVSKPLEGEVQLHLRQT